jgi:DNA/RNA non-specific endonuclease
LASSFELYLRTGRRIAGPIVSLETKFNPWHDPDDGRFTFAGHGRRFPGESTPRVRKTGSRFRSGGGNFGGGGAGGSWSASFTAAQTPGNGRRSNGHLARAAGILPNSPVARASNVPHISSAPSGNTGRRTPTRRPVQQPLVEIQKNGYRYEIDAHARTRRVAGEIHFQAQPRSRTLQAIAGKPDRRPTDDGGHYIAARFNGPRERFNHFAQDANFNRGAYRSLEDEWARIVRSGERVFVDIMPNYRGYSMRPYRLTVVWIVNGREEIEIFVNQPGGK